MKKSLVCLGCLVIGILFLMSGTIAIANELIYTPINPSFGGSPFNGQWLLNSAQMQDPHGFLKDKKKPPTAPTRDPLKTFEDRLTSQLLYRLSGQIVDAAFGEEGLEPGTYTVGDYIIDVSTDAAGITVVITDIGTGNTTTIQVPYY